MILRTILAAAMLFAPAAAWAGSARQCADLIISVPATNVDAITTTPVVMVSTDANEVEIFDPTNGWATSSRSNVAEWCWTPTANVERSDFVFEWTANFSTNTAASALSFVPGIDPDGATLASGDEIFGTATAYVESTLAADRQDLSGKGWGEVEKDGCVGILVRGDEAQTITVTNYTLELREIGICSRP